MNQPQVEYAQMSQDFDVANKYKTNIQFWEVVLTALYEEAELHVDTMLQFRLKEWSIKRRIRRNKKMHAKVLRRANRAQKRYNKWIRKESR